MITKVTDTYIPESNPKDWITATSVPVCCDKPLHINRKGIRTGDRNHRKGSYGVHRDQAATVLKNLRKLHETYDKNHGRQSLMLRRYLSGIFQLARLFEVLQSEEEAHQDGLSTSFECVEREIARCISGCLSDCDEQKRDISHILTLVKDYRVVTPLRDGSPSVSLGRIYSLIEDNLQGSCLRKLMGIMIAGHMNTTSQAVIF